MFTFESVRVLSAMFGSGGNVEPIAAILQRLVERGHDVHVLAGATAPEPPEPKLVDLMRRLGCKVHAWDWQAPVSELEIGRRGIAFGRIGSRMGAPREMWWLCGSATRWAVETQRMIRAVAPDVVIADDLLVGALVGAEVSGVPSVSMLHTVYCHRPGPGLPPPGPGLRPAKGAGSRISHRLIGFGVNRIYRRDALPRVNHARQVVGLSPLSQFQQQYDRSARVLVLALKEFDFSGNLPANVVYTGPTFLPTDQDSHASLPRELLALDRPKVLVSLSTNEQGQRAALTKALEGLASLPVQAIVSLGPALAASGEIPIPENAAVSPWLPHDRVLPKVDLVVTQAGHGTVMRALRHGKPLLCLPHCADQRDVAARVVHAGVGVSLPPNSGPHRIAASANALLRDRGVQVRAQGFKDLLRSLDGIGRAVSEVEAVAARPATNLT